MTVQEKSVSGLTLDSKYIQEKSVSGLTLDSKTLLDQHNTSLLLRDTNKVASQVAIILCSRQPAGRALS